MTFFFSSFFSLICIICPFAEDTAGGDGGSGYSNLNVTLRLARRQAEVIQVVPLVQIRVQVQEVEEEEDTVILLQTVVVLLQPVEVVNLLQLLDNILPKTEG